ncbi:Similar to G-protein coupled receptors [Ectocarpus siliculosus]|uniref:Similar to G-protein coupled receptors n=1 Tax=Ectocarpus siliculosus TaxID=2880 RepID=D7FIS7_ECTSI|nr:Similar to G-protein coupled receptors [Ectocarpus siliculosus]|eukprot:CBJ28894.1 Similar to G-protein coupled receptors [Ectocarpus siliculosus]
MGAVRGESCVAGLRRRARYANVLAASSLFFLPYVPMATAGIFPYDNLELEYPHLIYRESGMFAPGKGFLEIGAGGGDGESFIRLSELQFEADGTGLCSPAEQEINCPKEVGHVELAIFEQKSFGHVGVSVDDIKYYCCDNTAQAVGACHPDQADSLLLPDPAEIWWHEKLSIIPGIPARLEHSDLYRVPETGMYVVLVANCNQRTGSIFINGHSEWKNPYGYLPGTSYGDLPFFFCLAIVYLSLGVIWMIVCMVNIKDLLAVQLWASLVLFLGMVETGAQYFDYREWNLEGTRGVGARCFAIIFGAAKRSLSLSLVLMVCMGYGVVRPSLGRDVHKIMAMALIYFLSSALWVAFRASVDVGDKDFATRAGVNAAAMLVFVNATIMVIFFMWTIQAIVGVIQHLQVRGQTAKLALYVYFRRVLVGSAIFGVVWAVYGVVRSSEVEEERHWESYWTVDAIWEVLYLAVLVAVCFLLRPSMNSQRFSYAALPTLSGKGGDEDGGDILLQSIDDDAEFGGSLDEGEDKADEFNGAIPGRKMAPKPIPKKENQD